MYELLDTAARTARHYLLDLQQRSVAPSAAALEALSTLNEPLPSQPTDAAETFALLDRLVAPATMGMAGPRFFGFVIGGSLPVALAANWLAGAWDQNAALNKATPGVARLEEVAQQWLIELFQMPATTAVGFVTGATVANFTALAAARHAVLARLGWNVEADGLFGAPPINIVIGEEAHHAAEVPRHARTGSQPRASRPRRCSGPNACRCSTQTQAADDRVCASREREQRGIRPLDALIAQAHEQDAWVHVDGAFGLRAKAAPALQHLVRGLEHADSWATDAHKWLNVPYLGKAGLAELFERNCR